MIKKKFRKAPLQLGSTQRVHSDVENIIEVNRKCFMWSLSVRWEFGNMDIPAALWRKPRKERNGCKALKSPPAYSPHISCTL